MATLTIPTPATLPAGAVVATGVSTEDYLAVYAETFHEWVRGAVIQMSPASLKHDALTLYVRQLLNAYFELNPIGRALSAPFVMRLDDTDSFREPDVQVILNGNPGTLTDTTMLGPADICIEVVSPESVTRDYGEKFAEYEEAGVREYWIVDPMRQRCQFNRLDASGVYVVAYPDDASQYHTPLLPKLALAVPTLWQDDLPGLFAIGQSVQAIFGDHE
jgi:Uma2 family endonuclease